MRSVFVLSFVAALGLPPTFSGLPSGPESLPPLEAPTTHALAPAADPVIYDFDDLRDNCRFQGTIPDPYQDLDIVTPPAFAPCAWDSAKGISLLPVDGTGLKEAIIQLPNPASNVSVEALLWAAREHSPTLRAYDAGGLLVGSTSGGTPGTWVTLNVTGSAPIERIGLLIEQGMTLLDNLNVVYTSLDPQTVEECMDGGWEAFGFRNQGLCVSFVRTGRDSRIG